MVEAGKEEISLINGRAQVKSKLSSASGSYSSPPLPGGSPCILHGKYLRVPGRFSIFLFLCSHCWQGTYKQGKKWDTECLYFTLLFPISQALHPKDVQWFYCWGQTKKQVLFKGFSTPSHIVLFPLRCHLLLPLFQQKTAMHNSWHSYKQHTTHVWVAFRRDSSTLQSCGIQSLRHLLSILQLQNLAFTTAFHCTGGSVQTLPKTSSC